MGIEYQTVIPNITDNTVVMKKSEILQEMWHRGKKCAYNFWINNTISKHAWCKVVTYLQLMKNKIEKQWLPSKIRSAVKQDKPVCRLHLNKAIFKKTAGGRREGTLITWLLITPASYREDWPTHLLPVLPISSSQASDHIEQEKKKNINIMTLSSSPQRWFNSQSIFHI